MPEPLPRPAGSADPRSASELAGAVTSGVKVRARGILRRPERGGASAPARMLVAGAVGALVLGVVVGAPAAARSSAGLAPFGDSATAVVAAAPAAARTLPGGTKRVGKAVRAKRVSLAAAGGDGAVAVVTSGVAAAAPAAAPAAQPVAASNAPVPATPNRKARNVPAAPPAGSGSGRRIVYSKSLMTVWIVDGSNRVLRRYPVVGRWDRPAKGSYRVYSKSTYSSNEHSKVTFRYMVRFAWGPRTLASIGFHTIPIYYENHEGHRAGTRMHGVDQLGLPIAAGGCVRQSDADAEFLYRWVRVGDKVVVMPSP